MNSPRILYIDDETDLLDLAATFFEEENLPIETCSEFHEALNLIRNNKYDLIISDAKMPTGSGPELFRIVRSDGTYKGKIIMVTGNIEDFGSDQSRSGYDLVIYKPIRFQELVAKVKEMLSL